MGKRQLIAKRTYVFERDGNACQHCASERDLHLDHIVPTSKNGCNCAGNLQVLCIPCGQIKADGPDPKGAVGHTKTECTRRSSHYRPKGRWARRQRAEAAARRREAMRLPSWVGMTDMTSPAFEFSPDQQEALEIIYQWLEQPRSILTFGGFAGTGKALAFDQPVQTPDGERVIGELQVGDKVLGVDGRPTAVIGVFPQGMRQAYCIRFRDGASVECDQEHLWAVWTTKGRQQKKAPVLKTVRELQNAGLQFSGGANKFYVPLCEPVPYSEKTLPVHPYLLGLLIGDGTSLGKTPTLCTPDMDSTLVDAAKKLLPRGMEIKVNRAPTCPQYRMVDFTQKGNRLSAALRGLKLSGNSPDRFIPPSYLLGSVQQRTDLLQGLMDTDGSCRENRTSFSTSSPQLARDIVRLVQSLGGTAISHKSPRGEWAINVKVFRCPFRLERKAAQWSPSRKNPPSRAVVSIEPSRICDHVCIKVDATDGLFLTKDFLVTHNTTLIKQVMQHEPTAAVVAFTGKAVSVLRGKGVREARTLHNLIYLPAGETEDGDPLFKRRPRITHNLVIVDEASMINQRMHEDLEFLARKILYVGDHGQLQPIGYDPGLMHDPFIRLEKIHRQAAQSPILQYAHHLRIGGDPLDHPAAWVDKQFVQDHREEQLSAGFSVGHENEVQIRTRWPEDLHQYDAVLVGFNGKRHYLNKLIRETRGFQGTLPQVGETLICLHNHRDFGIFNGMQIVVEGVHPLTEETASVAWTDVDGFKRSVPIYLPQLGTSEKFHRDESLRQCYGLFDWGYCLTTHKAQGSEWDRVCVVESTHRSWDPSRWRYTAATRAAKQLCYVVEGRRLKS